MIGVEDIAEITGEQNSTRLHLFTELLGSRMTKQENIRKLHTKERRPFHIPGIIPERGLVELRNNERQIQKLCNSNHVTYLCNNNRQNSDPINASI
jgi:hypothetical protein